MKRCRLGRFCLSVPVGLVGMGVCGCPDFVGLLPDFAEWPVVTDGYTVQELPEYVSTFFVRGNDVYLGLPDGGLFKADDTDLAKAWVPLGSIFDAAPRLLFVSRTGTIFASVNGQPTYCCRDDGLTWEKCLEDPSRRMDEDELGTLYVGNYIKDSEHVATLYKSSDGGATWRVVFRDEGNHHIHTVRWDDVAKRLYIAFGDGSTRGQAFSEDRGETFTILAGGHGEGHTNVAFTANYVIWASDDQSGREYRVDRQTGIAQALMGRSQFMWFAVARDQQIYMGTITSRKGGVSGRHCLLPMTRGARGGNCSKRMCPQGLTIRGLPPTRVF